MNAVAIDSVAGAVVGGVRRLTTSSTSRPRRSRFSWTCTASILELIGGLGNNPAYVENKYTDCLAVNPLCVAFSPNYKVGVNLLSAVPLDPRRRQLRSDCDDLTEEGVAILRTELGPNVDDPRPKD
ncbi:hypothetical protein EV653_6541 [Kribbella pratensis]|uniref:MmyB-like transcription regulator ligand binding domain-containing protein n=1 Tax=Kribbella pratensis TaxID=2512112 RepID=A0A4R8BXB9_9ACTN|nr:hypothetical protein EV653_6541 [Kribbella pratensis]